MAGGAPKPTTAAAEYNSTIYARQGDLGSKVLAPRPSGTVWQRGSVVRVRQQSTAPHGGGYIYRLCPANETLTEACFDRLPLTFATPEKHTLRFADPTKDREVSATLVTEGGGKGWMVYPWPSGSCPGGVCDGACMYSVVGQEGKHCYYRNGTRDAGPGRAPVPGKAYCPGCGYPHYGSDGACPCSGGEADPKITCPVVPPDAGSDLAFTPDPAPGHSAADYALEDELRVPADIRPGDYVLGYRWDCEMTSQIWSSCSDISIV